jgi:tRNA pseudouridine55 synthase
MRNGRRAPEGLLLLDKPTGPTSHDIVVEVRKLLGLKKVGHAGTLDPLASGLLIILLGRATKLAPFLPQDPKIYEGSLVLGITTDTMDTEGKETGGRPYRDGPSRAEAALASLQGEVEQLPPMFSAVKHKGIPLYRYARRGKDVPRKSRKVEVYRAEMTAFRETGKKPEVDMVIYCSPGTYIRSLAAQVGDSLGCGAALSRLRRLASGPFRLEDALTMGELAARAEGGVLPLVGMAEAVDCHRKVRVQGEWVKSAVNGAPLEEGMIEELDHTVEKGETVAVITPLGKLVGFHIVLQSNPFYSKPRRIV